MVHWPAGPLVLKCQATGAFFETAVQVLPKTTLSTTQKRRMNIVFQIISIVSKAGYSIR